MKTIEELEALLEAVTRERDKLSVLVELSDGYRRERDEARAEAAKWKAAFENIRSTNTDLMMQLFDAQEATRAVNISPVLHENAQLRSKVLGLSAEVNRLTDERDELLVRVANQEEELRATREAYNGARTEVAQDIHLACLDARRDEREMIASWLSAEIHRLPVYQPSYGPKELRARSRALEGAACAVRICAHVPRVEDDDA
jgi:chromosome segregation ATPase